MFVTAHGLGWLVRLDTLRQVSGTAAAENQLWPNTISSALVYLHENILRSLIRVHLQRHQANRVIFISYLRLNRPPSPPALLLPLVIAATLTPSPAFIAAAPQGRAERTNSDGKKHSTFDYKSAWKQCSTCVWPAVALQTTRVSAA